jgi:hypothetical protein
MIVLSGDISLRPAPSSSLLFSGGILFLDPPEAKSLMVPSCHTQYKEANINQQQQE